MNRKQRTLRCCRQSPAHSAAAPPEPDHESTHSKLYEFVMRHVPIELPPIIYVGPATHAGLRQCCKRDPKVGHFLRDVGPNPAVCALELEGRPVQMHPGCPEGWFYCPPTTKDGKLIFTPIIEE